VHEHTNGNRVWVEFGAPAQGRGVLAGGEVYDRSSGGGGGECGAVPDELVEDDQEHQQPGGAGD
jgi:hypothetical protein